MKPKIHLNGSLGLLMLGVGSMPMILIGVTIFQRYTFDSSMGGYRPYVNWEMIAFFSLGVGFVISGIGLIFKINRARFLASVFIFLGALWMSYILLEEFRFRRIDTEEFWIQLSLIVFVYTLLFFGLLFMGNEKIKKDFGEIDEEDWDDNILDA